MYVTPALPGRFGGVLVSSFLVVAAPENKTQVTLAEKPFQLLLLVYLWWGESYDGPFPVSSPTIKYVFVEVVTVRSV